MSNKITSLLLILIVSLFISSNLFSQVAFLEATFSLKTVNGIKIPFQYGMPVPTFEKQNRTMINLAGQWKKQRFSANDNITLAKRNSIGYQNLLNETEGKPINTLLNEILQSGISYVEFTEVLRAYEYNSIN